MDKILFNFENTFNGVMKSPKGEVLIGDNENGQRPYNLLFGALGGCFYHTFLEVATKKRLTFGGAEMEISGVRRSEAPYTLSNINIKLIIKNADNEKQFTKTAELAAEHCSIHKTLSKVADISLEVVFE